MFPYTAQKADELTFYKGSVINVVSKDGEWWKGEMNGQTGMFPSNYVQPLSNLQMGTTQCKYMNSTLRQLVGGVTSTSGLKRKLKSRRGSRPFQCVVLQRPAEKCTKIYNARAELLFCSLNILFGGVLVAVAVVVCLSSLYCYRDVE